MSEFKKMVEIAVKAGRGENAMWDAVDVIDDILCDIEDEHPDEYKKYIRRMNEAIQGCHYTESIAKEDVSNMRHTDLQGKVHNGEHWNVDAIESSTSGKTFKQGTNKWDKYVAYNAAWHDFNKKFDDSQVLELAYLFFFADEDFDGNGKVWKYMNSK